MATKWWRGWRSLIPVAVLAMVLAGCGGVSTVGGGAAGEPVRGGELVMAVNVEAQTLDPAWCPYLYDRCAPLFGTLLRYDAGQDKIVPAMAESFESADGITWTLKLRPGVKFSDGTDYNAEAVAHNWARIKDPATLSTATQLAAPLTWTVLDPLTLQVTSATANFQLPWALTQGLGMIGSPTAMQRMGAEYGKAPVGAGPFLLDRWVRESEARYVRNPGYWEAGLPYLDSFVIKVIKADDQRINALRAGEIDIAWSTQSKHAERAEAQGFTVHTVPLVGGTGLNFNFRHPDLKDPELRLALQQTLDPAQINSALYPGEEPADGFLRPDSPYRDDNARYPATDVAAAQKIFDAYLKRAGKTSLTLTLKTHAGLNEMALAAQLLQSQLQQLDGLTITIEPIDFGVLEGMRRAGDFELVLGSTLSQQMDALYDTFHTSGKNNITRYSNPAVDAALETSRTSNDPARVEQAYTTINSAISADAPLRIWRYPNGYIYTGNDVQGLTVIGVSSLAGVIIDRAWKGR
ncbi:ABC transporter substrate-binding protein [Nocardia sp. NPDC051750]|uniref:ABC transporter substrate-binding protein n=1 Tax=Nocardia sp. NPDC051750 TaxID=3364325 RepID=UPI0037A6AC86